MSSGDSWNQVHSLTVKCLQASCWRSETHHTRMNVQRDQWLALVSSSAADRAERPATCWTRCVKPCTSAPPFLCRPESNGSASEWRFAVRTTPAAFSVLFVACWRLSPGLYTVASCSNRATRLFANTTWCKTLLVKAISFTSSIPKYIWLLPFNPYLFNRAW